MFDRDPLGAVGRWPRCRGWSRGRYQGRRGGPRWVEVVRSGAGSPPAVSGCLGEAAPGIPPPRSGARSGPGADGSRSPGAALPARGGISRARVLSEAQTAVADSGERVAAEPSLRPPGHLIELASQSLQHPLGVRREGQGRIGGRWPCRSAYWCSSVSRFQNETCRRLSGRYRSPETDRVADRQRQSDLPEGGGRAPHPPASRPYARPPG